jgi:hypothetical protein
MLVGMMMLVRSLTELDERLGVLLRSQPAPTRSILKWVIQMDQRQRVSVCNEDELKELFDRDFFAKYVNNLKDDAWVYGLEKCRFDQYEIDKQNIHLVSDDAGGRFYPLHVRVFEHALSWYGGPYVKAVFRYNIGYCKYVIVWQDRALQTTYTPVYAAPDPM